MGKCDGDISVSGIEVHACVILQGKGKRNSIFTGWGIRIQRSDRICHSPLCGFNEKLLEQRADVCPLLFRDVEEIVQQLVGQAELYDGRFGRVAHHHDAVVALGQVGHEGTEAGDPAGVADEGFTPVVLNVPAEGVGRRAGYAGDGAVGQDYARVAEGLMAGFRQGRGLGEQALQPFGVVFDVGDDVPGAGGDGHVHPWDLHVGLRAVVPHVAFC